MADWPLAPVFPAGLGHITPLSLESIGSASGGFSTPLASTTWGTANLAKYIPFRISQPYQVANAFCLNGATATGNVDIGIYDADGTRLASTGATALSGTTAIQTIALSVLLGPGQFWLAMSCSASTTTFLASSYNANCMKAMGCYQQTSAHALPATATFATIVAATLYMFGITNQSVV